MSDNPWAAWLREYGTVRYQLSRKAGWNAFVHAASRPPFETLTPHAMAALDEDTLEDYNEARLVWNANPPTIKTHQLARCFDLLDQAMASSRRDGDRLRSAVVIDAEPGLGKTTIATRYARRLHRREHRRHGPLTEQGHQRLPVAFVPLAAGTTLKGLNQQLLEFYGHPAARRATRAGSTPLAVDCVTACETRLIVVDDLHFIDFKHRNGLEVSNHLKSLANVLPVTFLFVGVNLEAKRFFDEGLDGPQAAFAQTSRRTTRCPVLPFSTDTPAARRAWVDLLTTMERHLILARSREGMLTEHADELYRRTQGRLASLVNLVAAASYEAIRSGREIIDRHVLDATVIDNAAERLSRTA